MSKSIADVLKEFSASIINVDTSRVSTGSVMLDYSLGGGLPIGISTIYGPAGVGKTTLALSICREMARKAEESVYIDAEGLLTSRIVSGMLSDDESKYVNFVRFTSAEQTLNAIGHLINNGVKLIVLDTIAALSPEKEIDGDVGDAQVAIIPRLFAQFARKYNSTIIKNGVRLIILNQARDVIGSYIKSFSMPGGWALKHFSMVIIPLGSAAAIKVGDKKIGQTVSFRIEKNKTAAPDVSGKFNIIYGIGVHRGYDLLELGVALGIIIRNGNSYKFDDKLIAVGKDNAADVLLKDDLTFRQIYDKIMSDRNLGEAFDV